MPHIVDLAAAQRLDRRSRAAQHKRRAGALGHPCGHIARVVARSAFLLIGAFVFFVDDDEAKRCHGAKERTSRTHDHALFAQAHRFPLVEALACCHARVHNRHGIAEAVLESRHRLRGKRDFGHEHDGPAPQLERMANRTQVDFGFARPRHAVDHAHLAGAAVDTRVDARERRSLAFGKRKALTRLGGLGDFFIERHGRLSFALLLSATRRLLQLPHIAALHDLRRAAHGREQMHARAEGRHVFMSDKLDKRGAVLVEIGRGKHREQRLEARRRCGVDFGIEALANLHDIANRTARAEFDKHGATHLHADHISGNYVGIEAVERLGLYVQN